MNRVQQAVTYALAAIALATAIPPAFCQSTSVPASRPLRRSLPLTKFYDTPNPLPDGKPGALIRSQEFDSYDLPLHVLAVRILYHSRSAAWQDVAVSGVVLYPDGKPPSGGWPVLAWAHELDGVARQCAQSLERNLHSGPALSMYVNLGYAVVLPDYAGLGTSFRSAAFDLPSNATDLIYSVAAARAAVSQLGARWMAVGSGQGGSVAVKAAELEHEIRDPNYLGGVAISNLVGSYDPSGVVGPQQPLFLTYGMKTVFPDFNEQDLLSEKAFDLYRQVEKSCTDPSGPNAGSSELFKPDWANNRFVKMYFDRNTLGLRPAQAPILLIDSGLPQSHTIKAINRICERGDQLQLIRYPQSNAASLFGDSIRDQIAWIQARFAGRPVVTTCPGR